MSRQSEPAGRTISTAPASGPPQTGGVARPRWLPDVVDPTRTRLRLLLRRGRTPGLRTAKTVLAAVLAFQIATWLDTSSSPILAPLTALLVVQLTMYETFAHGLERIVSVVAGVLLALLF